MDLSNITLTTDRLLLTSVTQEFVSTLFEEFTSEISEYMAPRPAKDLEEQKEFIHRNIERSKEGKELVLIILNKETKEFIGRGGIWEADTDTPEFGIWIKKTAQGQGFAREACQAFKKWAETNLKYSYLKYPVDRRNIPSIKIAELLGGIIKAEYQEKNKAGEMLEVLEYRVYKEKSVL